MWSTPKQVKIKDAGLECVNIIGILLVIVYVVIYEMLYQGSHLQPVPVSGVNQIHIRHPTVNYCDERQFDDCHPDFSSVDSLPYCKGNSLEYAYDKKDCEEWSSHVAEVIDGGGVSLSTRVRKYNVTTRCIPNSEVNGKCEKELDFTLLKDVYLADVERFWIWIEHSMTSGREGLSSKSSLMNGYYYSCESESCQYRKMLPVPEDFGEGKIPQEHVLPDAAPSIPAKQSTNASLLQSEALATRTISSRKRGDALARKARKSYAKTRIRSQRTAKQHAASSAGSVKALNAEAGPTRGERYVLTRPSLWSMWEFDTIPLQYLLDIVNVSLDDPYKGMTYRMRGLVITIQVRYLNTQVDKFDFVGLRMFPGTEPLSTKLPWDPEGHTRARYQISARAEEQGYVVDLNDGDFYTGDYIQRRRNGIYIDVAQSGEILVWSWSRLAIHVSTAIGLLSVAFNLTRLWAWACRSEMLQSLLVEEYVLSSDSGKYERIDRHEDLT
eukprot:TRINITY_DN3932_c0_g1_i2.p1 TRINITY_DN3932_c0_g1~~TRINITY_DN3932_c0_g1_i2.p1  ORF type:complete len:496 (-),score=22.38 TRINITY_DN3932_c0_g1_i2:156-1643(-)